MTARKVWTIGAARRRPVRCLACPAIFHVDVIEGEPFDKYVTCDECRERTSNARATARGLSGGECAMCGRPITLEDKVLVHLERERDEFHSPVFVTAGE